ncbi:hypothetical protein PR048_002320 [Dryococelus australis]|uniref:Uncharacterized protein n=1 Tax=Dryococelus australis TaxID=614101 RepID=A0ABQ9IJU8_9NEOP|nr:hypothetical protein PR048_002320 [Dryococelus australis]
MFEGENVWIPTGSWFGITTIPTHVTLSATAVLTLGNSSCLIRGFGWLPTDTLWHSVVSDAVRWVVSCSPVCGATSSVLARKRYSMGVSSRGRHYIHRLARCGEPQEKFDPNFKTLQAVASPVNYISVRKDLLSSFKCNVNRTFVTFLVALLFRDRGGVVARLFVSHLGEPGPIPGGAPPRFPHVGIVPDDAAAWRVLSGISRIPPPCIPALLHTHLTSRSPAHNTSMPDRNYDYEHLSSHCPIRRVTIHFVAQRCSSERDEVAQDNANNVWSSAGMQGHEKREIPEKTHRLVASSSAISTRGSLGATPPGIEPGSHWCSLSIEVHIIDRIYLWCVCHLDLCLLPLRRLLPRATVISDFFKSISSSSSGRGFARWQTAPSNPSPLSAALLHPLWQVARDRPAITPPSSAPRTTPPPPGYVPALLALRLKAKQWEFGTASRIPEKTCRATASSGTISTCENPGSDPALVRGEQSNSSATTAPFSKAKYMQQTWRNMNRRSWGAMKGVGCLRHLLKLQQSCFPRRQSGVPLPELPRPTFVYSVPTPVGHMDKILIYTQLRRMSFCLTSQLTSSKPRTDNVMRCQLPSHVHPGPSYSKEDVVLQRHYPASTVSPGQNRTERNILKWHQYPAEGHNWS